MYVDVVVLKVGSGSAGACHCLLSLWCCQLCIGIVDGEWMEATIYVC